MDFREAVRLPHRVPHVDKRPAGVGVRVQGGGRVHPPVEQPIVTDQLEVLLGPRLDGMGGLDASERDQRERKAMAMTSQRRACTGGSFLLAPLLIIPQ
jgi:hypothetical protein